MRKGLCSVYIYPRLQGEHRHAGVLLCLEGRPSKWVVLVPLVRALKQYPPTAAKFVAFLNLRTKTEPALLPTIINGLLGYEAEGVVTPAGLKARSEPGDELGKKDIVSLCMVPVEQEPSQWVALQMGKADTVRKGVGNPNVVARCGVARCVDYHF